LSFYSKTLVMSFLKHFKMAFFLLFILMWGSLVYAQEYTLTVQVSNIKEKKGNIILSLFDNINDFLKEGKEYCKQVIQVKDSFLQYTFMKVPKGHYAVALYHDVNGDGKCNKNILGLPKEGFGFSRNYVPILRSPAFKEVQFEVNQDQNIRIKLIHF
ncbi:MAG TPA: DUF2141 domain-containing protein, partial [Bacteroidales bacterium]|nr:DUF2141 domain-containing protein [Bacteroidales bacterium]